ncbi:MAG: archaeosine biosynthesis radical SAM protein RaSEA [Thermoplasmatota archaeon]
MTDVASPHADSALANPRVKYFTPLAKASREARKLTVKSGDASEPSTTFTQPDVWDHEEVTAFVIILRTRGCRWALSGGCTFCGYVNDSFVRKIESGELVTQFERALTRYNGEPIVKIYTSGSFLDPYEVDEDAQVEIARRVPVTVKKWNVEAQAPDVTRERVAALRANMPASTKLEIGVGLESANAAVARYSVNKEFFLADFASAAEAARAHGASLKCYTMVKPPFLTEREAMEDCIATARLAGPHASLVSFNPTNIQKHTLVDRLWKRGEYRPPWLWTVVEILRESARVTTTPVKSDPVAGGMVRGAHNCGKCDEHALRAIRAWNSSQDARVLDGLDCSCRQVWLDQLELEGFLQGPLPDQREEE